MAAADDESLEAQISEMQIIIIGGEEWIKRAENREIKRSPEEIEKRQRRLNVQYLILTTLEGLRPKKKKGA